MIQIFKVGILILFSNLIALSTHSDVTAVNTNKLIGCKANVIPPKKNDTILFTKYRDTVPFGFLKRNTNIDSIYFNESAIFMIDSFVYINDNYGICILNYDDGKNCVAKLLLACDIRKNISSNYLIGGMDCDIDEGVPYTDYTYKFKIPYLTISERSFKFEHKEYLINEVETTRYKEKNGKFIEINKKKVDY